MRDMIVLFILIILITGIFCFIWNYGGDNK